MGLHREIQAIVKVSNAAELGYHIYLSSMLLWRYRVRHVVMSPSVIVSLLVVLLSLYRHRHRLSSVLHL